MPRRTTSAMGDLKDVHPRKSFVALLSAVALTVLCAPLSWSEASQCEPKHTSTHPTLCGRMERFASCPIVRATCPLRTP